MTTLIKLDWSADWQLFYETKFNDFLDEMHYFLFHVMKSNLISKSIMNTAQKLLSMSIIIIQQFQLRHLRIKMCCWFTAEFFLDFGMCLIEFTSHRSASQKACQSADLFGLSWSSSNLKCLLFLHVNYQETKEAETLVAIFWRICWKYQNYANDWSNIYRAVEIMAYLWYLKMCLIVVSISIFLMVDN